MNAVISNLEESTNSRPSKRRKIDSDENETKLMQIKSNLNLKRRWRTESEQRTYSSKFVEALHRVSQTKSDSPARSPIDGREVHQTADRILAVAAKGKTRWSRAILKNRINLKLKKHKKVKNVAVSGCNRQKRSEIRFEKRKLPIPVVERKVRALGRLVPGCRKISFPNLLEEATDYIAALQMQVRAMTAVAELLAGAPSRL